MGDSYVVLDAVTKQTQPYRRSLSVYIYYRLLAFTWSSTVTAVCFKFQFLDQCYYKPQIMSVSVNTLNTVSTSEK